MLRPLLASLVAAVLLAAPLPASAAGPESGPRVGDEAPDFTLKDQDGKEVTLSSFRGKKNVAVAFYPKDFSPGCTAQMKCVTREWRKVEERGATVLAISGDSVASHREFATSVGTRFPLLSDSDFAVAKKYGVHIASADGSTMVRSVFLVDREGKIRWAERDFIPPRTLQGGEFLKQLDLIRPAEVDPAEQLAALPSPEKEAKTVLVRFVQAHLREDVPAVDALLHENYGLRGTETAAMAKERRKADLEKLRKTHEAADLKSLAFGDVIDLRDAKVFAKGDHLKPGALGGFGDVARKAAADLADGDVLVAARTKAPKLGDTEVIPREFCLTLRKVGEAWKVLAVQGK